MTKFRSSAPHTSNLNHPTTKRCVPSLSLFLSQFFLPFPFLLNQMLTYLKFNHGVCLRNFILHSLYLNIKFLFSFTCSISIQLVVIYILLKDTMYKSLLNFNHHAKFSMNYKKWSKALEDLLNYIFNFVRKIFFFC